MAAAVGSGSAVCLVKAAENLLVFCCFLNYVFADEVSCDIVILFDKVRGEQ